jgi:hypothetical protein
MLIFTISFIYNHQSDERPYTFTLKTYFELPSAIKTSSISDGECFSVRWEKHDNLVGAGKRII